MPKPYSPHRNDISEVPHTRPEEKDTNGLEGRDEPEVTGGGPVEGSSDDVLVNIVAILDSLDQWQKNRMEEGA